jgi:Calcium binding
LEERLEFPFTAKCVARRAVSPLLIGDEVEVISMAPAEECSYDMFVMIRWEHGGLGVPLSQIAPTSAGSATQVAVADWHYWVGQGYQFR